MARIEKPDKCNLKRYKENGIITDAGKSHLNKEDNGSHCEHKKCGTSGNKKTKNGYLNY
jgi:hypothetical protein